MRCAKCGIVVIEGARFCQQCGTAVAVPPAAPAGPPPVQDDWVARQIPYKNPLALAAYYVGLFSVIPCIGPLLALAAIPLGAMGLRAGKRDPALHGTAHAWTGMILAAFSVLYHIVGVVLLVKLGP
jgi:hypothetical protein